ncbi:MAG: nucleoside triphosphate pyrophosphohydrolase [Armatimonadetes bacterium]|nr:nucleoside triphosphate pyrophosphohydrolase [Armatimonadota bacterium]
MESFDRLVDILGKLRGPGGCPWDREQTHQSLRRYLLEETYEALEQLDAGDLDHLADELGDLLLQIVFHAQLGAEAGRFDIDDVCNRICEKMVRRHPHVFGDTEGVQHAEQVLDVWEQAKRAERGGQALASTLDGVPKGLPALVRAWELQRKAAKIGFDWPDQSGRLAKVAEELAELDEAVAAGDPAEIEAEFGDLMFVVVNVGRALGLSAEDALRGANAKFERRFRAMEVEAGGPHKLAELDLSAQDALWDQAKAAERAVG